MVRSPVALPEFFPLLRPDVTAFFLSTGEKRMVYLIHPRSHGYGGLSQLCTCFLKNDSSCAVCSSPRGTKFPQLHLFIFDQLNGTTEEVRNDIGRLPVKGLFPHTSTSAVLQADLFLCAETTHKADECAR